jgi:hypothetical protein
MAERTLLPADKEARWGPGAALGSEDERQIFRFCQSNQLKQLPFYYYYEINQQDSNI